MTVVDFVKNSGGGKIYQNLPKPSFIDKTLFNDVI